ncbi:MAG TPA: hypothetical protein VFH47_09250 [Candidatus Thermoplasmatota archaeon]|nr:hypothetical protein [Candidatus Thermoplasmatota archaeon]
MGATAGRHVMHAALATVVVAATLAGCASGPEGLPCDSVPATTTVVRVSGSDIVVDGGDLVLHASRSTVWLAGEDACTRIAVADVRPGQPLGHDAREIATSYPAQAWPENIVVRP